jgi:hypothetical protein
MNKWFFVIRWLFREVRSQRQFKSSWRRYVIARMGLLFPTTLALRYAASAVSHLLFQVVFPFQWRLLHRHTCPGGQCQENTKVVIRNDISLKNEQ